MGDVPRANSGRRFADELDDIPNIGLDDLDAEDILASDQPLEFDLDVHDEQARIDAFELKMEEAKRRYLAAVHEKKVSKTRKSRSASSQGGTSDTRTSSSTKYSDSHDADRKSGDKSSSADTESHKFTASDVDEDEDDWDEEFLPGQSKDKKSHKSLALSGLRTAPRNPEGGGHGMLSADKEPLLEHLDAALRKKFSAIEIEETPTEEDAAMFSQRAMNEDEEFRGQDFQHLRGLPLWIRSSTAQLTAASSSSRPKPRSAWELLDAELHSLSTDPLMAEQMLERCSEDPEREACLFSLEIVMRWVRGVCLSQPHLGSVDPDTCPVLRGERLGRILSDCDKLLHEQAKHNTNRVLADLAALKIEVDKLFLCPMDSAPTNSSRSGIVGNALHGLANHAAICRLQLQTLQIRAHSRIKLDSEIHLELLESLWEELETMRTSWLAVIAHFLPADPWEVNGRKTIFPQPRDETIRMCMNAKMRRAADGRLTSSIFYHSHVFSEAQALAEVIVDLQACCLVDKFLLLSRKSPLTMLEQEGDPPSQTKHASSTRSHLSFRSHSINAEPKVVNVAYELGIGSQFVEMMLKLATPSVVRAKLAFAAHGYLRCLQKEQLPWQRKGINQLSIARKPLISVERKSSLRRGISEMGFAMDAPDLSAGPPLPAKLEADIVQAFSNALGPVDDIRNMQLLLYEATSDVLPNTAVPQGQRYGRALFDHAPPAIDVNESIQDHVNNKVANDEDEEYDRRVYVPTAVVSFELLHLTLALVNVFSSAVHDALPNCSLGLLELCLLLSQQLNRPRDVLRYRKRLFLLAARVTRADLVIAHGKPLLMEMIAQATNADWKEVLLLAETLTSHLSLNAQYEQSIRIHCAVLQFLRKLPLPVATSNLGLGHSIPSELLRFADRFVFAIAKDYLDFGCAERTVGLLQKLLCKLMDRPTSLHNDQQKVLALSSLAEAYLQLRDFDACNRIVKTIKIVRQQRMHALMEKYFHNDGHVVEKADNRPTSVQSLHFLDHISQGGSSSSHHSMNGFFRNNSAEPIPRHPSSEDRPPSTPNGSDSGFNLGVGCAASAHEMRPHYARTMVCLLNPPQSCLPRHCIAHHNVDLGFLLAKVYYQSKLYLSALNSLTPTIIGSELLIGGKLGSKSGMQELGQLYYLRGKIQLDACQSPSDLKYPFEVGSSQLFAAIQAISTSIPLGRSVASNRRIFLPAKEVRAQHASKSDALRHSIGSKRLSVRTTITCRRAITYHCPADLVWDAMKWFRKAWDFFHAVGDEISAAKAANRIAECHLLPMFAPHALLGIPLDVAKDLSTYEVDSKVEAKPSVKASKFIRETVTPVRGSGCKPLPPLPPPLALQHQPSQRVLVRESSLLHNPIPAWIEVPAGQQVHALVKRFASLEEVERVTTFALDIHLEASLPLELMESYLNFAELSCLQGNMNEALPFWWETKDLFCYLFADGSLVPIARRCSFNFLQKIERILDRIVRFIWKFDTATKNSHLFLLDMHIALGHEIARAQRTFYKKARQCGRGLAGILRTLISSNNQHGRPSQAFTTIFTKKPSFSPPPSPQSRRLSNRRSMRSVMTAVGSIFGCTNYSPESALRTPSSPYSSAANGTAAWGHLSLRESVVLTTHLLDVLSSYDSDLQLPLSLDDEQFASSLVAAAVADKVLDFGWSHSASVDHVVPPVLLRHVFCLSDIVEVAVNSTGELPLRSKLSGKLPAKSVDLPQLNDHCRPLDPFIDFKWMDEAFAPQQVPRLPGSASRKRGQYLPPSSTASKSTRLQWENECEKSLIQRVWTYFLRIHNICRFSRSRKMSTNSLNSLMRGTLDRIYQSMTRIRSFSRQYKASVTDYALLTDLLFSDSEFTDDPRSGGLFQNSSSSSWTKQHPQQMKAIRLQERLPKLTYVVHVHDLLLVYHPENGRDCVRKLGSANTFYHITNKRNGGDGTTTPPRPTSARSTISVTSVVSTSPAVALEVSSDSSVSTDSTFMAYGSLNSPRSSPLRKEMASGGIAALMSTNDEAYLSAQQTALIFDFCVQDADAICGGGATERHITLDCLRGSGPMSVFVQFFEECATAVEMKTDDNLSAGRESKPSSSYSHESKLAASVGDNTKVDGSGFSIASLSSTSSGGGRPVGDTPRPQLAHSSSSFFSSSILGSIYFGESMLLKGTTERSINAVVPTGSQLPTPPMCDIPLTLICSHSIACIPWEGVLRVSTVRSLCLSALLAQLLSPRPCCVDSSPASSAGETLKSASSDVLPILRRFSRTGLSSDAAGGAGVDAKGGCVLSATVNHAVLRGFLGPAWVSQLHPLSCFGLILACAAPEAVLRQLPL